MKPMDFTCNQAKNDAHILNRGLPLLAASAMFTTDMLVREDVRKAYPERRFVGYNTIDGRLMVVVFCMPSDNHTHHFF